MVRNRRNVHKLHSDQAYKRQSAYKNGYISDDNDLEIDRTVKASRAALIYAKSKKPSSSVKCELFDHSGGTEERCFWSTLNLDNKLPTIALKSGSEKLTSTASNNSLESSNITSKQGRLESAGSVVEITTIITSNNVNTYTDSVASTHWIHEKNIFVKGSFDAYKMQTLLLANNP